MSEHQRQRVERRVNITPYRMATWDPFQDLTIPVSRVWDQDFGGMPSGRSERLRYVREPWPTISNTSVPSPSHVAYLAHSPSAVEGTQLHTQPGTGAGVSQVTKTDGKYQILLDVKHFTPEEITVKTVGDVVEIRGCHDEKQDDHGVISRNFTRKYTLPKDVDPLTVTSYLSSEGFLTVEAPLMPSPEQKPKAVTVQHS